MKKSTTIRGTYSPSPITMTNKKPYAYANISSKRVELESPIGQVLKKTLTSSKPEQPGIASLIRSEVTMYQTLRACAFFYLS